ncbi:MAG: hypothetical protein ISS72_09905 [Candidatus Brocadiae bacterium]|nr:hypothetical protein [Candidatus Brocadiia bacterium]
MMRGTKSLCVVLVVGLLAASGCVRREIRLLTTPPGAMVEMDGQYMMTDREVIDREGEVIEIIRPVPRVTPITLPFNWYGTHEFIVHKDGYVRQKRVVHMRPPWYQQIPIDFFADNLIPWTIHDIRTVSFDMKEAKSIRDASKEEKAAIKKDLLQRADQFRTTAKEKVPAPVAGPPAPEGGPAPAPPAKPTPKAK